MKSLSTEEIKNLLTVSREAESSAQIRTLETNEIKDLLAVAREAEPVVSAPAPSLLDAFMANIPSQVWLGEKLTALWKTFPIASLIFVIIVSILH